MQQNYEVMRFVQQNGKYHIVMDYVEGEILCNYLRKESFLEKRLLFQIILLIAKELSYLERCDGKELYPHLTPLHIVMKKDNTIAFMKASEKYNQQIEEKAALFLTPDGVEDYIYSYGRTTQFLLSNVECVPNLSWKEERKFKIIISKCLNYKSSKRYKSSQDIVNQLNPKKKKKIIFLLPLLLLPALVASIYGGMRQRTMAETELNVQKNSYEILRNYLEGDETKENHEIESIIKDYRASLGEEISIAQKEFLLQIYSKLDSKYGNEQAILIGSEMFEAVAYHRENLANIYLENKDIEGAVRELEILVKESPSAERYIRLINLLEQSGRQREAMMMCEEGSRLGFEGTELQLQYVRLLLMDSEFSMNEKKFKLEEFISLYPMLNESQKFKEIKEQINFEEMKDES